MLSILWEGIHLKGFCLICFGNQRFEGKVERKTLYTVGSAEFQTFRELKDKKEERKGVSGFQDGLCIRWFLNIFMEFSYHTSSWIR